MTPAALTVANPFPGLRSFEAAETHLFFGREKQTDELLRRLERSRLLAVVGTSGSGKSSLVRAGLIPSLEGGYMASAGSRWKIALLRPGADPVKSLAGALTPYYAIGETTLDAETRCVLVETTLRRSSLGLVSAAREAGIAASDNLLIIVDQFEEIFRFRRKSEADGQLLDNTSAFVKLLLGAAAAREAGIFIVLTMRSDFLGDCAQFPDLPEAINEGQYLIPRMTREERRRAIEGPVAVGGAAITIRLVQRLLNDVGDNPDQLPVLQHALMRAWSCWEESGRPDEPLDLEHYDRIGGIANALSTHADEAFQSLSPMQQTIARDLFQSLCERGTDGRETRRPAGLAEICAITEQPEHEVVTVIDAFRTNGRTFLMPPYPERLDSNSVVDISHESLIRLWERLREWVNEEARFAAIYERLADAALRFEQEAGSLWRDPELRIVSDWKEECQPNQVWADRYQPAFAPAMAFLEHSQKARQAQRRKRRVLFVGLMIGAACFAVLAATASLMWWKAEHEKRNANAALKLAFANMQLAKEHAREARAATEEAKRERDHWKAAESQAKLAAAKESTIAAERKRALDSNVLLQRSLLARYLARQAEALAADPTFLRVAALLGIESLNREASPEGRSALSEILMILPKPVLPKPEAAAEALRSLLTGAKPEPEGAILGAEFASDNKRIFVIRDGSATTMQLPN